MNIPAASLLVIAIAAHPPSGAVQEASRWNLSGMPSRILHDFSRLPTLPSIAVLGVGGGVALAVHPADARAVRTLSGSTAAEESLDGGATLGGAAVQIGIAAGVYGLGLVTRNGTAAEVGSALVETQVVQSVITQGLKYAVDRTRPDGGRYSFPSGHTAASFTTADIVMQRFGWRAGAAAYIAAAYVGASRIADRQHYFSDVVFGAAVGIASARTFSGSFGHTAVSVNPVALHGGAAVMVSVRPHAPAPATAQELRKPDVFYVPTPQPVVDAMLAMAKVTSSDVVYDLGCGDGRIPITAAQKYGARGVGIDIDPERIAEANENAKTAAVTGKVTFLNQDLFTSDFSDATVVTLYLLPSLNEKLIPKLKALKPGTRIVSHAFDMGSSWPPDAKQDVDGKTIYFWVVR